eukprot:TRINITY_DN22295_c0_g1_i1.p1 TRINITY_DN22295_c0_g1~~TRINITY_DN22295_c0_g1_i1.p1  ORF type:complete len:698 (+),score=140.63 TRINITY_DN22295_c0_g1_i1:43-2094(+)
MASAGSNAFRGAMRALQSVLERTFTPDDDGTAKIRKTALLLFACTSSTLVFSNQMVRLATRGIIDGEGLYWVWTCCVMVLNLSTLASLFVRRRMGDVEFVCWAVGIYLCGVMFDLHQAAGMQARAAPCFVVVLDVALVGRMPEQQAVRLALCVVAWMILMEVELISRFGLLDVWGTATVEQRHEMCSCATPPCGPPHWIEALTGSQTAAFIFILDFLITRRFASQVREEEEGMRHAVAAAKDITAALARFDLVAATASLDVHRGWLTEELLASFETLVANLGSYKPYLPPSCLPIADSELADELDRESVVSHESSFNMMRVDSSFDPSRHEQEPSSCMFGAVPSSTGTSSSSRSSSSVSGASSEPPASPHTQFSPATRRLAHTVSASFRIGVHMSARPAGLRYTKMSLLNVTAQLPPLAPPQMFIDSHEAFLIAVLTAVAAFRGMVDTFVANRLTATFNATRPAATHAKNAASAAARLSAFPGVQLTGAVAMGVAAVGILGTETMRRQSIVGPLPTLASDLERFALACGCDWVCNRMVFIECALELRLRVLLDRMSGAGEVQKEVYEIMGEGRKAADLSEQGSVGHQREGAEWMYELEHSLGKEWEAYNAAGALYLRDGGLAAAVAALQDLGGSVEQQARLRAAIVDARVFDTRVCVRGVGETVWMPTGEVLLLSLQATTSDS